MQALKAIGAAAVGLVVSGACCCAGSHSMGQLGSTPPAAALAKFQNFPADRVPRPIVRMEGSWSGPDFATVPQLNAFFCNLFEVTGVVPSDMPSRGTVNWSNGDTATYPAMSAMDTIQTMRSQPVYQPEHCVGMKPVEVTGMRSGSGLFGTDRGRARMTSWVFKLTGALGSGEYAYPAIPASAFWDVGRTPQYETVTVSSDGRSLTYGFMGTQADGRWGNSYNGLVAESMTAVELAVQRIPNPSSLPDTGPAADHPRSVTITLQSPLGGRVVIDAAGDVIPVCPESMGANC
jgi:hypothetical protein